MGTVVKDLIQYNGIEQHYYNNVTNFKQFDIQNIIHLPNHKPTIDEIAKVWADYEILEYEIVETAKGISLEGQVLTGKKLFIASNIYIKIDYISNKYFQTIYSSFKTIPVCTYLTIDDEYNECSSIYPTILIEDIYCEQLDCQKIYLNAVLMAAINLC